MKSSGLPRERLSPALEKTIPLDSEMGLLVRQHNWSATTIGPIAQWQQSLRTIVALVLRSPAPMFVWWGPDLLNIYNDAYIPTLGARHPAALGQPARTVWSELWPAIGPGVDAVVQRGASIAQQRMRLVMERNGYPEETFFSYWHSPVIDDFGEVGGLFSTCSDETAQVKAEVEQERLASQRQLALDAARMGWWHYDPLTKISRWDERFMEIFGVASREKPNAEILARIHPDDLPSVWSAVEAALDPVNPTPYATTYRIRRDDGSVRWIEAHGAASFEGEGSARHASSFVGTVEDVTDRRLHEEHERQISADLIRFNRVAVGRELRIIEIKKEVNALCHRLGEPARYPLHFDQAGKEPELHALAQ